MNVKLAAQVLSNSVSNALLFCENLGDYQFYSRQAISASRCAVSYGDDDLRLSVPCSSIHLSSVPPTLHSVFYVFNCLIIIILWYFLCYLFSLFNIIVYWIIIGRHFAAYVSLSYFFSYLCFSYYWLLLLLFCGQRLYYYILVFCRFELCWALFFIVSRIERNHHINY